MQLFSADATIYTYIFTPEKMKKPPSKAAHNWPRPFFSVLVRLPKRKSRTTKSPLMQDWVFRLGFMYFFVTILSRIYNGGKNDFVQFCFLTFQFLFENPILCRPNVHVVYCTNRDSSYHDLYLMTLGQKEVRVAVIIPTGWKIMGCLNMIYSQ